jgi:hypothetical protein
MVRALSLAALIAAGFSCSALAADEAAPPATDAAAVAAYTAQLSVAANAAHVRQLLQAQGYTNVSDLNHDEDGRWSGTAVKNGKTIGVAIALPSRQAVPATN